MGFLRRFSLAHMNFPTNRPTKKLTINQTNTQDSTVTTTPLTLARRTSPMKEQGGGFLRSATSRLRRGGVQEVPKILTPQRALRTSPGRLAESRNYGCVWGALNRVQGKDQITASPLIGPAPPEYADRALPR